MPETARAFLPPHGVMPWMRLIAFGLDDGAFRDPGDTAWWSAPYPLVELYPTLGTWADIMAASGHTNFSWDSALADGDSSALAQSLMVSAKELEDVVEQEGCPKFIPNKVRGFPPTPNPACWKPELDKLKDVVEKLHGGKKSSSAQGTYLLWLALAYIVIRGRL